MKYLECKYIKKTINHPVLSGALPGTPLMALVPSAPLELWLGMQAGAALLSPYKALFPAFSDHALFSSEAVSIRWVGGFQTAI